MTPDQLLPIIQNFADHIGRYAVILAAVATIVMALLELIKAVTYARPRFHKSRVLGFLDEAATAELVKVTVGDVVDENALFDEPTDKMMGQFGGAAKMALDFPTSYPSLYAALTRTDGADAVTWRTFVQQIDAAGQKDDGSLIDQAEDVQRRATRARARLDQSVTRKLDAFQLRAEYVWARSNQYIAVGGAAIFLGFLLFPLFAKNPFVYVFSCIVGGLMSPLAKDVVAALSGLRAKA